MGHRHNRRRFRWRYKDNTKKWSATGCRLDAEEGVTLAHSLHSYQDLLGSHELPHDSEAGSRSTLDGSGHLGTLAELEEAQRRMFGGEVGDEVSLCAPMLRVVVELFGDVDYTDP